MCRDADPLDRGDKRMFADARVLRDQLVQDGGDGVLALGRQGRVASLEGLHGLVAGTTRGQEHNGWREVFVAECPDQVNRMDGGRHATSSPSR